ncbi:nitroreductase family protein [Methylotetracoccus oryzae]|uniref:nitroreductase family protein n=1 Tax=Methylotetracoccus oryzae TaxID=1919059 RepID=UPI001F448036|nr:nitroreductase family protein [Methylotetracoccus oryzae]
MQRYRRVFTPIQGGSLGTGDADTLESRLARVLAYHERTKHRVSGYARGPEALDWSGQPDPFRHFDGCARLSLPLLADTLTTPFSALSQPGSVAPQPVSLETIGLLFELSLGLSAWKTYGPDRWAVRCNPSSGNLHPTESYLLCRGIEPLDDGLYHYRCENHSLERRRGSGPAAGLDQPPELLIGLSSIHWREAWKYGERAFRYCQLDLGHAIGALRYAAAALGWQLRVVESADWAQIARRLGLDRRQDFVGVESEEAEVLLEVVTDRRDPTLPDLPIDPATRAGADTWYGTANVLDRHPMYHWPVIDEVAEATRRAGESPRQAAGETFPPLAAKTDPTPAATLIRQRRSAQRFDSGKALARDTFYDLLDTLLPRALPPWDVWRFPARMHLALMVHRVEDLEPGLYILPRAAGAAEALRAALNPSFDWQRPTGCPEHLPLFRLAAGHCGSIAKTIHCHQAIATDSAFALGMLAEYEAALQPAPWLYRELHWEAGLLGQALYLEAEARGLRGTGIGCFFDDSFHELLGLTGRTYQSLYHFTVGYPITDSRIISSAPYAERD